MESTPPVVESQKKPGLNRVKHSIGDFSWHIACEQGERGERGKRKRKKGDCRNTLIAAAK